MIPGRQCMFHAPSSPPVDIHLHNLNPLNSLHKMKCIYLILALYMYVGNGFDFDSTPQNITITAGTNSSMVNIPVTDDDIVEGDETFSMSLTVSSSLGPGVRTGTITSATVTINDTTSELCYWYCLFPFL